EELRGSCQDHLSAMRIEHPALKRNFPVSAGLIEDGGLNLYDRFVGADLWGGDEDAPGGDMDGVDEDQTGAAIDAGPGVPARSGLDRVVGANGKDVGRIIKADVFRQ